MGAEVYCDFSGGLNLLDNPNVVSNRESVNALNVIGTQKGTLQPRKGVAVATSFAAFLGAPHQIVILAEFNPRNLVLPAGTPINGSTIRIRGETRSLDFGSEDDCFLSPYFDPNPGGGAIWGATNTSTDASASVTNVYTYVITRQLFYCTGSTPLAPTTSGVPYSGPYLGSGAHNIQAGRGPLSSSAFACTGAGTGTTEAGLEGTMNISATFPGVTFTHGGYYITYTKNGGSTRYAPFEGANGAAGNSLLSTPTMLAAVRQTSSGALGSFANPHNYVLTGIVKVVSSWSQT